MGKEILMKHSIPRQMWKLNNDYTVTDGAGNVTFSYQVKNGAAWADVSDVPTNVGTYRVKAVVAENDNYKGAETDWKEFIIRKATPSLYIAK